MGIKKSKGEEWAQPAGLVEYISEEFPRNPQRPKLEISRTHPYVRATFGRWYEKKFGRILLAPFYDVQYGVKHCDEAKLDRHVEWFEKNPEVFTWGGGDLIDWNTKLSIGAGIFEQEWDPDNQIIRMAKKFAPIQDRFLLNIPGNHERRGAMVGVDAARWYSTLMRVPYFGQPVILDIVFRGHTTRVYIWHGRGAARTEGAITNMTVEPAMFVDADIVWCGHLHRPRVIHLVRIVAHPETMRLEEREIAAVMSPSYLKYFGSYAAVEGYRPAPRGLVVAEVFANGKWQVEMRGRKFA